MMKAPVLRAHTSSSMRRAIESATPVGNWCEGVTNAARALGAAPTQRRPPDVADRQGWRAAAPWPAEAAHASMDSQDPRPTHRPRAPARPGWQCRLHAGCRPFAARYLKLRHEL